MGPPSHMRSVVDRNVVMRRIPVLLKNALGEMLRPVSQGRDIRQHPFIYSSVCRNRSASISDHIEVTVRSGRGCIYRQEKLSADSEHKKSGNRA